MECENWSTPKKDRNYTGAMEMENWRRKLKFNENLICRLKHEKRK